MNFIGYTTGLIIAPLFMLGITLYLFFDACIWVYKNKRDKNAIGGEPQAPI